MKPHTAVLVALAILLSEPVLAGEQSAAELVQRAHECDNMYSIGPGVSQQNALRLYESALQSGPDNEQRLHILYRMAQLYGTGYEIEKGEKPDFHKAIQLYEQIVDSYPPDEPLVFKAKISIGDHYTALWQFENALEWFKKALEYDTAPMQQQLQALQDKKLQMLELDPPDHLSDPLTKQQRIELQEQLKEAEALKSTFDKIKRYQQIAVDQVAYCGDLVDPWRAHGELRVMIAEHSGTFIAERARQRLAENMDRRPELWMPTDDLPTPSNSSLQAGGSSAGAVSESPKSIEPDANIVLATAGRQSSLEANTAESSQPDKHTPRQTRAPPLSYLSVSVIGAAGLILLGLAVVIIRRKTPFWELDK
ncbi:MAG: tetratricopeptide repeat protein [Planctomycetota bacterium]|jgi:tetratricopeptide (TPR) repeat protein